MADTTSDGWVLVESHCEGRSSAAHSVDKFCKVPVQNFARHWLHTQTRTVVACISIVYVSLTAVEWATTVFWLANQPVSLLCVLFFLPFGSVLALRWVWSTGKAVSFFVSFAWTISAVVPGYAALALLPSLWEKGPGDACLWPTLTVVVVEVCECLSIAIAEEWKEVAEDTGYERWCSYLTALVELAQDTSSRILATMLWLWMSVQLHQQLTRGVVAALTFPAAETPERAQLICALHVAGIVCRAARRRLTQKCVAFVRANAAFRSLVHEWREGLHSLSDIASWILRYARYCIPPRSALLLLASLRGVAPALLAPFAAFQILQIVADKSTLPVCGGAILIGTALIVKRVTTRTASAFPLFPDGSHHSYLFFLVPSGLGLTAAQRQRFARVLHFSSVIWGALGSARQAIAALGRPFASCVRRRIAN